MRELYSINVYKPVFDMTKTVWTNRNVLLNPAAFTPPRATLRLLKAVDGLPRLENPTFGSAMAARLPNLRELAISGDAIRPQAE
jgi:hypothetical protein